MQQYKLRVMEKNSLVWHKTVWPGNQSDFLYRDIEIHMKILQTLFLPQKPLGRQPKTVVLHGIPGVGKTTLAKKVMLLWSQSKFYPHKFKYAFYFRCQDLNQAGKHSFLELVQQQGLSSQTLISKILSKPDELLLLFDGFEELTYSLIKQPDALSEKCNQKLSGSVLLSSLLSKQMLPEATLLIILRPAYWCTVNPLLKNPFSVIIPGFNRLDSIKYFRTYFRNTRQSILVLDFVKTIPMLFSLCQAPVVCWMVCFCLKEQLKKTTDLIKTFPNVTSVLVLYFSTLIPTIIYNFAQNYQERMGGLCYLAAQGMWKMKSVFDKQDFEQVGMDEACIHIFLQVNVLRKVDGPGDLYVFSLFIFQEFLAALFYLLYFPRRLICYQFLTPNDIWNLVGIFSKGKNCLLNMALFLFGLFNTACFDIVRETYGCKVTLGNKLNVERVILLSTRSYEPHSHCGVPQLFHCLAEVKEEFFVKFALLHFPKASVKIDYYEDLCSAAFCLKCCQHLKEVELRISQNFSKELSSYSHAYQIQENNLYSCWWHDICSVFMTNEGLEVLTVANNLTVANELIEHSFMKALTDALKQSRCNLQRVHLNNVPCMPHEDLIHVLTENHLLQLLETENMELKEMSVKTLGSALKLSQRPLEYLRFESCVAPQAVWACLARDLHSMNNKTLLLRKNYSNLFWVPFLSMVYLKSLALENCNITEAHCKYVAFTLRYFKVLTHLSLAENALKDNGVKYIWNVFPYLTCPLKRLVLRDCSLTSTCCQDMIFAFKSTNTLKSLDLSFNGLQEDGVIFLCEALMEPKCHLQILEIERCLFTFLSCPILAHMFQKYRKLRYLDLSKNNIGTYGMLILAGAFTTPEERNKVFLEKKADVKVDMHTRLMGPEMRKGFLKIVQDWNS